MQHHSLLPEGLFPVFDESLCKKMNASLLIEAFLDAEALPFIIRFPATLKTTKRVYIDEMQFMRQEMEFDFIIENDVDLALDSEARGVHLLGPPELIKTTRQKFPAHKLIGYTTSSVTAASEAKQNGADYIFFGPCFSENGCMDSVLEITRKIEIPVYATGGIDSSNLLMVKDAGAAGFSAINALYKNEEIEHNANKLNFMWQDL